MAGSRAHGESKGCFDMLHSSSRASLMRESEVLGPLMDAQAEDAPPIEVEGSLTEWQATLDLLKQRENGERLSLALLHAALPVLARYRFQGLLSACESRLDDMLCDGWPEGNGRGYLRAWSERSSLLPSPRLRAAVRDACAACEERLLAAEGEECGRQRDGGAGPSGRRAGAAAADASSTRLSTAAAPEQRQTPPPLPSPSADNDSEDWPDGSNEGADFGELTAAAGTAVGALVASVAARSSASSAWSAAGAAAAGGLWGWVSGTNAEAAAAARAFADVAEVETAVAILLWMLTVVLLGVAVGRTVAALVAGPHARRQGQGA